MHLHCLIQLIFYFFVVYDENLHIDEVIKDDNFLMIVTNDDEKINYL